MNIKRLSNLESIKIGIMKKGGIEMEVLEMRRPKTIIRKKTSISTMEKFLGLNNAKSITPSLSDLDDKIEKGDCFADWYEEELSKIYEKYNNI